MPLTKHSTSGTGQPFESRYLKLRDVEGEPIRLLAVEKDETVTFDSGPTRAVTLAIQRLRYDVGGDLVPTGPTKSLSVYANVLQQLVDHFANGGGPIDVVFRQREAKKSGRTFWDVDPVDGDAPDNMPF